MQPLIDGDIIRYEIGFAAEVGWKGVNPEIPEEELNPPPFDYVADLVDNKISNICGVVGATQPPIIFLSGEGNFRYEIAKRQPYKTRTGNKPYHFNNITAYLKGKYDCRISEGVEADDLMAIEQTSRPHETIICTRDKDLRQVPGWHFGWELGNQPQFGPELVDEIGYIKLSSDRKSITGTGGLFFYSQLLTGDPVDSIPGLPKCGAVKAYELLHEVKDLQTAHSRVLEAYILSFEEDAEKEMLEQAQLLHMVRVLDEEGKPIMWRMDNKQEE